MPGERRLAAAYVGWAVISIAGAIAWSGLGPESLTRLGVLGFLLLQLALHRPARAAIRRLPPRVRFLAAALPLAAVVEGLHMISTPVFASLVIDRATPLPLALSRYAMDLALTLPAYVVVFAVIERFARRFRYTRWEYVLVMGAGQALGDGGIYFFAAAPWMLAFLPYPMTNYHALNVLPYLAIEGELAPSRPAPGHRFLAVPVLIGVYFVCGALIRVVGRHLGLLDG